MSKHFIGTCVGGIADGRSFQHDKPEMHVGQMKKGTNGEADKATGNGTNYKYLLLLGGLRGDIAVWVPEGVPPQEAAGIVIQRLLECYRPDVPKRGGLIIPSHKSLN